MAFHNMAKIMADTHHARARPTFGGWSVSSQRAHKDLFTRKPARHVGVLRRPFALVAAATLLALMAAPPAAAELIGFLPTVPFAASTGIPCSTPDGSSNFRLAEYNGGSNYEIFVLVEDDPLNELLQNGKYVRVGWTNKFHETDSAQTIEILAQRVRGLEVIFEHEETNQVDFTGVCGAIMFFVPTDLDNPAEVTTRIDFSGAVRTIVNTAGEITSISLSASISRSWSILVSRNAGVEVGGEFTFGGTWSKTWSSSTSVSVTSYSKTGISIVPVSSAVTVPFIVIGVPADPISPTSETVDCVAFNAAADAPSDCVKRLLTLEFLDLNSDP